MGVINLGILIKKLSGVFLKKSDIDSTLSSAGYVKNTDYPGASTAGVVKVGSQRATSVTSSGVLQAATVNLSGYNDMNQYAFIGKATLENIIGMLVQRELVAALGGTDSDPDATTLTAWKATKGADGWTISATKS